jgi:hypothetical protein
MEAAALNHLTAYVTGGWESISNQTKSKSVPVEERIRGSKPRGLKISKEDHLAAFLRQILPGPATFQASIQATLIEINSNIAVHEEGRGSSKGKM